MPTGVALRDPRQQLFDAAVRVLMRGGVTALTSRAITDEAGVAKGVLHRHFADFDAFLVDLVLDRIAGVEAKGVALRDAAGTGTVAGNLTDAIFELFEPVMSAIIVLTIARDELRNRLRAAGTARFPLVGESVAAVAGYLAAEHDLGRIAADADVQVLAPTLIGAVQLLFTEHHGDPPVEDVRIVVASVLR
ncbi:TetR/AcrR family transcriptional regulator [Micromonospora sp. NPDC000663]|uniref:TetR/AcrR family transcriptional regulator n=1 Tax=Micromonospora sp. NPDC000663 TaxID=3364218 RepID=UPI0036880576